MWGLEALLIGLGQAAPPENGGVALNLATLGAVTALLTCTTGAISLLFRQLLTAKDQRITYLEALVIRTEARADSERERGERDVAAERVRTDAALAELREALGLVGGAVGHAERAVETVARAERRRAG